VERAGVASSRGHRALGTACSLSKRSSKGRSDPKSRCDDPPPREAGAPGFPPRQGVAPERRLEAGGRSEKSTGLRRPGVVRAVRRLVRLRRWEAFARVRGPPRLRHLPRRRGGCGVVDTPGRPVPVISTHAYVYMDLTRRVGKVEVGCASSPIHPGSQGAIGSRSTDLGARTRESSSSSDRFTQPRGIRIYLYVGKYIPREFGRPSPPRARTPLSKGPPSAPPRSSGLDRTGTPLLQHCGGGLSPTRLGSHRTGPS
jgi:hypothetical protein